MKNLENDINQVLRYTQCVDIWLFDRGEHEILSEYENYVKFLITENNLDQIKTLSEWLSSTNIELFAEYDSYVESSIKEHI